MTKLYDLKYQTFEPSGASRKHDPSVTYIWHVGKPLEGHNWVEEIGDLAFNSSKGCTALDTRVTRNHTPGENTYIEFDERAGKRGVDIVGVHVQYVESSIPFDPSQDCRGDDVADAYRDGAVVGDIGLERLRWRQALMEQAVSGK